MSSIPVASFVASASYPSFDENRWVIQIRRNLEDELEDDAQIPVCIFKVPIALMSSKPEAYIPQQIALGPYHYLRSELYDMERYKLVAAKSTKKKLQSFQFQSLVDQLIKLEPRIRCYYYKYLDLTGETLAWMMAVDGSFLLEFLLIYAFKEGKNLTKMTSRMSILVDYAGLKLAHNAILRDVLLLENQIPMFVLQMILELQYSSVEEAHDVLRSMFIGLCKEISPFIVEHALHIHVIECAHLLDFLYNGVVPKSEQVKPFEIEELDDGNMYEEGGEGSLAEPSQLKAFFNCLWKILCKIEKGPLMLFKKVIGSKPAKLAVKLPWAIISRFPLFSKIKGPLQQLFSIKDQVETKPEEYSSPAIPMIEEIHIPSVVELCKSGVRFVPIYHGIQNIKFDIKHVTLHLPTISLDVHTELVLRNLVAYEASTASGPMVITRYVELMNGIVDTEEDVRILRDAGIVLNHLKSDSEVADLWNGMSMSIKLTRVPFLDKVIEDVNTYYNNKWKVKFAKMMKIYVFQSWMLLTFLGALFFLFLMIEQSVCEVYKCSHTLSAEESQ